MEIASELLTDPLFDFGTEAAEHSPMPRWLRLDLISLIVPVSLGRPCCAPVWA